MDHVYLDPEFSNGQIRSELEYARLDARKLDEIEVEISGLLAKGATRRFRWVSQRVTRLTTSNF